jgi:hypothetical protein
MLPQHRLGVVLMTIIDDLGGAEIGSDKQQLRIVKVDNIRFQLLDFSQHMPPYSYASPSALDSWDCNYTDVVNDLFHEVCWRDYCDLISAFFQTLRFSVKDTAVKGRMN